VPPVYESRSNGPLFNADAWVNPDTGVATVVREYMTSAAGDQGSGWWVSPKAAPALRAHEEKHVTASRGHYEAAIEPVVTTIMRSFEIGRDHFYLASNAVEYLKGKVGWRKGLEKFHKDDQQSNQPWGTIDNEDFGKSHYPVEDVRHVNSGPDKGKPVLGGTVAGKPYEHLLYMQDETIPDLLPLEEEPGQGTGTRH
jgi:hypothetical protein